MIKIDDEGQWNSKYDVLENSNVLLYSNDLNMTTSWCDDEGEWYFVDEFGEVSPLNAMTLPFPWYFFPQSELQKQAKHG